MSIYSLTLSAALLSGLALPAMAATPAPVHHKAKHAQVHRIATAAPEPAAVRTPAVTATPLPGSTPVAAASAASTSAAAVAGTAKPATTTAAPAPAKPAVQPN